MRALELTVAMLILGSAGAMDGVASVQTPLIPRAALHPGDGGGSYPAISPDGRYLVFIKPKDGVPNVWLARVDDLKNARPITDSTKRGFLSPVRWANDSRHILYEQDDDGNGLYKNYSLDVESGRVLALNPQDPSVTLEVDTSQLSAAKPGVVLASSNDRDPAKSDLYELDVATGKRSLVERNDEGFARYLWDSQLKPRVAVKNLADGRRAFYRRTGKGWERFLELAPEDTAGCWVSPQ